jgi:hypothetical protein
MALRRRAARRASSPKASGTLRVRKGPGYAGARAMTQEERRDRHHHIKLVA